MPSSANRPENGGISFRVPEEAQGWRLDLSLIHIFLVSVFHLPIYTVAGATLAATFVNALAGVLFYIAISPLYPDLIIAPDWGMALLLSLGGLLGMYFGAKFQKCISPVLLKWMLVVRCV